MAEEVKEAAVTTAERTEFLREEKAHGEAPGQEEAGLF